MRDLARYLYQHYEIRFFSYSIFVNVCTTYGLCIEMSLIPLMKEKDLQAFKKTNLGNCSRFRKNGVPRT